MAATAVVTGANSGIGLATALRLAADGYVVHAGARRAEGLDAIADAASAAGVDEVHPITLDVDVDDSVADAFATILRDGPVDVLVNNAGITGASAVEDTVLDTYREMLETNVLGVVRCTQQVLPGMREARRGRIVNISSAAAIVGPPAMSAYALSKFALEGFSESLQSEVAPFGIRVIVLRPGTILTPIWGKAAGFPADSPYAASYEFLLQLFGHSLGNTGVGPDEVAAVISATVADDAPALRHLVGDADGPARMRAHHTDEEICVELYALDDDARRIRYRDMTGTDLGAS